MYEYRVAGLLSGIPAISRAFQKVGIPKASEVSMRAAAGSTDGAVVSAARKVAFWTWLLITTAGLGSMGVVAVATKVVTGPRPAPGAVSVVAAVLFAIGFGAMIVSAMTLLEDNRRGTKALRASAVPFWTGVVVGCAIIVLHLR